MTDTAWFAAGWVLGCGTAFVSVILAATAVRGSPLSALAGWASGALRQVTRPRSADDVRVPRGVRPGTNGHIETDEHGVRHWVEDD